MSTRSLLNNMPWYILRGWISPRQDQTLILNLRHSTCLGDLETNSQKSLLFSLSIIFNGNRPTAITNLDGSLWARHSDRQRLLRSNSRAQNSLQQTSSSSSSVVVFAKALSWLTCRQAPLELSVKWCRQPGFESFCWHAFRVVVDKWKAICKYFNRVSGFLPWTSDNLWSSFDCIRSYLDFSQVYQLSSDHHCFEYYCIILSCNLIYYRPESLADIRII